MGDEGHTWYEIQCHLAPGCRHWTVHRRLSHIRRFLHDPVKSALGDCYPKWFDRESARFASHGGPSGTTARLRNWLAALVANINNGNASPKLVALTLRFTE